MGSFSNMKTAFLLGVVCLLFLWDFGKCSPIPSHHHHNNHSNNCHDITLHYHHNDEDISVEFAEGCEGRASGENDDDDDDDDDDDENSKEHHHHKKHHHK